MLHPRTPPISSDPVQDLHASFLSNCLEQKFLETYCIVPEKPTLNEQLEPDRLNLFQNDVT